MLLPMLPYPATCRKPVVSVGLFIIISAPLPLPLAPLMEALVLRRLEFFKRVLDVAGRHTLLGNLETMPPTAAA